MYILTFADGYRYVGQALNMVGRFATHRRRWEDIVTVEVCRVPATQLDAVERDVIHEHGRRKQSLRNVTYALGDPAGDSDLDWVIEPHDQMAWLTRTEWIEDVPHRVDDPIQRQARRPNFVRFSDRADFQQIVEIARLYVQGCVPRPRATELTFWSVSAMAGMNRSTWPRLVALSINKMETLVIGHYKSDPDKIWCFINVGARTIAESSDTWVDNLGMLGAEPHFDRDYEAAGGDSVSLEFDSLGALAHALDEEASPVVAAARELNLRLMRKGPTFQWRWHCFDLADFLV